MQQCGTVTMYGSDHASEGEGEGEGESESESDSEGDSMMAPLVLTPFVRNQYGQLVGSHNFDSQHFKSRVSNTRTVAHFHFEVPPESSNLPGLGPFFKIELLKADRATQPSAARQRRPGTGRAGSVRGDLS